MGDYNNDGLLVLTASYHSNFSWLQLNSTSTLLLRNFATYFHLFCPVQTVWQRNYFQYEVAIQRRASIWEKKSWRRENPSQISRSRSCKYWPTSLNFSLITNLRRNTQFFTSVIDLIQLSYTFLLDLYARVMPYNSV